MRGGERVLQRLCTLFPDAPIHTLLWNRGAVSKTIEAHPIHVSFVQYLPDAARRYRWYLPIFPRAIETFSLEGFDAVISSSHCVAKAVRVPRETFHLSYVHTPMRYIWELENEYFPPGRFPWPLSWYVRRTCASLRIWDVATSGRPDALIANSAHVAARIAKHYGREAEVIHPPVDVEPFRDGGAAEDFYLLAGAFAPYKRGELAIEACLRLGKRLVVAGSGQEAKKLVSLGRSGVEFLGWVSDQEMRRLYARARALIFPGEEDFGIISVEAMASGCPGLAFGRGGALETVGRGMAPGERELLGRGAAARAPGGILFAAQTVDSLCDAIRRFETESFGRESLAGAAEPFARERFDAEFMRAFERLHSEWKAGASSQPRAASTSR